MSARRLRSATAITACTLLLTAAWARGQEPGWQAELSRDYHNVSGTVTIVDADTFRIDNFTYDGGGPSVYFYLGAEDTTPAFTNGVKVPQLLTGTVYNGSQGPLLFDLAPGDSFDGLQAISVWCDDFYVSFGSGAFAAPSLPGNYNGDLAVDAADYTVWRDNTSGEFLPADYDTWRTNYGAASASSELTAAIAAPEPPALWLLTAALATLKRRPPSRGRAL
ncbi:Electron transfer DM13 [Posidoniimonas polymericola]|uniref:Electron transfer DM13 n=1 Tax=Posidoniimonas polymericola TaxID=2528002 RepID=A0A5C5YSE6_9BACT|nr:DM13 domain-containing protein [Posidoniimonas polymericola]TWT77796.1 Electron transfer DM13 [Posidoniimonas polymericola]